MTKPNLVPFDQIKEPLRLPEQQIVSEQVPRHPPPHLVSTELGEFFKSCKVLLQPLNDLKLSPTPTFLQEHSFWTNTHQLYPQSTQAWYT